MGGWLDILNAFENISKDTVTVAKEHLIDGTKAVKGVWETDYDHKGPFVGLREEEGDDLSDEGILATDTAERTRQQILKRRVERVEETLEALALKYNDLISLRITHRPLQLSWVSPLHSLKEVVNKLRGMPTVDELNQFISEVNRKARMLVEEGDKLKIWERFQPLVKAVNQLGLALTLLPELLKQDQTLSRHPFEGHEKIESKLNELSTIYEIDGNSLYFNALGAEDKHPLNKDRWLSYYRSMRSDLKHLKRMRPDYLELDEKIDKATVEVLLPGEDEEVVKDLVVLPTLKQLNGFNSYIDKHFVDSDGIHSKRFTKLKEAMAQLKTRRQARIDEKKEEAELFRDKTLLTFREWQEKIETFKSELAQNEGELTFPWTSSLPSEAKVMALKSEAREYKESLRYWPSAQVLINEDQMDLEDHQFILGMKKKQGQRKIEEALNVKEYLKSHKKALDYTKIKEYIDCYKHFLVEEMADPEADKIINKMQLQLFFYTHKQLKKRQWYGFFSFLKISFWKPSEQKGWEHIVSHANGETKGYTGKRTLKALTLLGWLNKNGKVNAADAPTECVKSYNSHQAALSQLKSTFTDKAVIQ